MVDAFRSMLDEMMGKDRDLPLDLQKKQQGPIFDDPDVCIYNLCGLCPYTLFTNTKTGSKLGKCKYSIHDDALNWEDIATQWDQLPDEEKQKYGYESSLHRLLTRLVKDMDMQVRRAERQAAEISGPKDPRPSEQAEIDQLKQEARELMDWSEGAAESGDIDASLAAVSKAEKLQAEYARLHAKYTAPERVMEVCKVCGVFIQLNDKTNAAAEGNHNDHFSGKTYIGWKAIRDKLDELRGKRGYGEGEEEGEVEDERGVRREGDRDRGRRRWDGNMGRRGGGRGDRRRKSRSRSRDRYDYDRRRR